jgi:hypothetical protein
MYRVRNDEMRMVVEKQYQRQKEEFEKVGTFNTIGRI